jgi:hypothetical protein
MCTTLSNLKHHAREVLPCPISGITKKDSCETIHEMATAKRAQWQQDSSKHSAALLRLAIPSLSLRDPRKALKLGPEWAEVISWNSRLE